jgi:hypothetical protein
MAVRLKDMPLMTGLRNSSVGTTCGCGDLPGLAGGRKNSTPEKRQTA